MKDYKIINAGIVAHVDAGKTTLTEQLLYRSGELRNKGNVDDGTAQTELLFEALKQTKTPTILLINKIDRIGSDVDLQDLCSSS